MMKFTIAEAAEILRVSPLTLRTWLAEAAIDPEQSPTDKRSRILTREQIERLARQHRREVVFPHGSMARDTGEVRSLSDLVRHVTGLEGRLAHQDDLTKTIQALALVLREENKRQNEDIDDLKRHYRAVTETLQDLQESLNSR